MSESNANARLEALSDGVFAIALTLLVIEVRPPAVDAVTSTQAFWHALQHAAPAVAAFVLSFTIIFITWVNHHGAIRMIPRTSAAFIYANGFLLLTVAFIPFPTALLGEFVLTDHAGPAVVMYDGVLACQAIAWILISRTALSAGLTRDDHATQAIRGNARNGVRAFFLYAMLAVVAVWFPLAMAIVTTATWVFWLILGFRLNHA